MKNPLRTESVIYTELKEMEQQLDYYDDAALHNVPGAFFRSKNLRVIVNKLHNELAEKQYA